MDQQRLALTGAVMRSLRDEAFRALVARSSDGTHPIIVAMPLDPMSYVFERLKEHHGSATIVTQESDGALHAITVRSGEGQDAAVPPEDHCPVHSDTPVLMLLAYLQAVKRPIRCHEVTPDVRMELVDAG